MKFIELTKIMDMDEHIIVRYKSANYHTTPNEFMKEHAVLCQKNIVFQSVRHSAKFGHDCIMIRLSGIEEEEKNKC